MDHFETDYIPILALRPAEMNALEELPRNNKALFIPSIQLKPWMNSTKFENSLMKVASSWNVEQPWIVNLDREFRHRTDLGNSGRPAVKEFVALCEPSNGFSNWVEFVTKNENCIPTLQVGDSENTRIQATSLDGLNRGLVVHLNKVNPALLDLLAVSVVGPVLLIVDFEEIRDKIGRGLPAEITAWSRFIGSAFAQIANLKVAISSTSFPRAFADQSVATQNILERELYNTIASLIDAEHRHKLIYSDRASARIKPLGGGGGIPIRPRIDYPNANEWCFFRSQISNIAVTQRDAEYIAMAKATMVSDRWISGLKIWGTSMIERTANGDYQYGINSPVKSTTVRLNLHMHHQTFYADQTGLLDTEDDWVD